MRVEDTYVQIQPLVLGKTTPIVDYGYPLVMTNIAMENPSIKKKTVNHLFLWAISHGYVSHKQRIYIVMIVILVS